MEAGALILLIAIVALAVIAKFLFSGSSAREVCPPADDASELQRVKVRHVIDGDTVIVSKSWSQTRIRLDSIDCPEDG